MVRSVLLLVEQPGGGIIYPGGGITKTGSGSRPRLPCPLRTTTIGGERGAVAEGGIITVAEGIGAAAPHVLQLVAISVVGPRGATKGVGYQGGATETIIFKGGGS